MEIGSILYDSKTTCHKLKTDKRQRIHAINTRSGAFAIYLGRSKSGIVQRERISRIGGQTPSSQSPDKPNHLQHSPAIPVD